MNRITPESLFLKRVSLIRGPPWWQWLINVTSIMEVIMYEKYFNKLREECLIRNRSSRTADTYINNIRHFMKWTGYKPMEDLSLQDARSFILEKRNSGLSSATCNFYNSSICFLYKHVLHIPWDQDIVPRMRLDVKLPKVLSLEEIEKLINCLLYTSRCV